MKTSIFTHKKLFHKEKIVKIEVPVVNPPKKIFSKLSEFSKKNKSLKSNTKKLSSKNIAELLNDSEINFDSEITVNPTKDQVPSRFSILRVDLTSKVNEQESDEGESENDGFVDKEFSQFKAPEIDFTFEGKFVIFGNI